MALKYGFFNSVNGDRKYTAEDLTSYLRGLVSDGIIPNPSHNFQVFESTGMNLTVEAGKAFIDGFYVENTTAMHLSVETANVAMGRFDAVVLKLDKSEGARSVSLYIKKGTAGEAANALVPIREGDVKELILAYIHVGPGVTSITQANIIDTRPDAEVCGWVVGLIDQIDASTAFAQIQAAFDEWFSQVRNDLTTSTLVREQRDIHITTTQDQTVFEINKDNVPDFKIDLDILDVYINGLKLTKDIEYTYNSTTVTLTNGLDIGQQVEIVVFKSVDGYKADSVISQVEDLQRRVYNNTPSKQTVQLPVTEWTLAEDGYYYQTVQASILKTVNDVVQVCPAPDSVEDYGRVYASEQAVGRLTFKSSEKPEVNLNVNLVNFGVML